MYGAGVIGSITSLIGMGTTKTLFTLSSKHYFMLFFICLALLWAGVLVEGLEEYYQSDERELPIW